MNRCVRHFVCVGVVALLALGLSSHSFAQRLIESSLKTTPRKKGDKRRDGWAPRIRAVITTDKGGLKPESFTISDLDLDPPVVGIQAVRAKPYVESDEPLAVVVLVQGTETWMGTESFDDEDPIQGAFGGLSDAVNALSKAGPPGSRGGLLVYHEKPEIKQPLEDLASLNGGVLGAQENYKGKAIAALLPGLDAAKNLLANEGGKRKVLVVVGDGIGQRNEIGSDIKDRAKAFRELGVAVYTIYYRAPEGPEDGQGHMLTLAKKSAGGESFVAPAKDNIKTFAETIVKQIGARYYVDFPGEAFTWDAQERSIEIEVDGDKLDPASLRFAPETARPSSGGGSLWWLWLLLVLVVVIVLIILIVKRQSKAAPMPVMEAPPPEAPAEPAKTVMLGLEGSDEGMPIVGWIVPLQGPNQYQTFKLYQGATKIGSGQESHIVIDDHFMSTTHAEVVCSPGGFVLNDAGSTNGMFVNQRRVKSHDLVDNDVFTLGKTDFKFKSIN